MQSGLQFLGIVSHFTENVLHTESTVVIQQTSMVTNKAIQAKSSVLMMIKWLSPNYIILEALHWPSECIGTGSLLTSAPDKFPQLANECYK